MLGLVLLQVKGLLDIVSAASEFDTLPLRPGWSYGVEVEVERASR